MCGIVGIIGNDDSSLLDRMTNAIHHRGPDSTGTYRSPSVQIANLRLAQKDLDDRSNLPFENDRVLMAFNGEIYNFQQLKQDFNLEEKYQFQGTSDSEVLFYLFQEIGIDLLNYISGMFTLFFLDKSNQKAYLARDFFGMTPMFYTQSDSRILFCSEIKGLLEDESISRELNPQAFFDLFTLAYIPEEQTPFKAIHELLPGEVLEIDIDQKRINSKKYFEFVPPPKQEITFKRSIETTENLFLEIVEEYIQNDAPIGTMLSGGLDTSLLLVALKKLGKAKDFPCYSLQIQDPHFNEKKYQDIMIEYSRAQHHIIKVDKTSVLKAFDTHLAFVDEPYGHGAAIPTFLLAQEARKSVKALLSGEGGDEIFNGYETHGAFKYRKSYRNIPSPIRAFGRSIINQLPTKNEKLSLDFLLKRFSTGSEFSAPYAHVYWRHLLTDEAKKEIFVGRDQFMSSYRFYEVLYDSKNYDDIDWLSIADTKQFFYGDLMIKNDRMVYAHSVESRFPYMDKRFVDHVLSLPSEHRYPGFKRRKLQKSLFNSELPTAIQKRSGFGLELPYNSWLQNDFETFSSVINKANVEKLGFLKWDAVEELIHQHIKKKMDHGRFLWALYITLKWFELFVENESHKKIRKEYLDTLQ